jgi:hypothetical protein
LRQPIGVGHGFFFSRKGRSRIARGAVEENFESSGLQSVFAKILLKSSEGNAHDLGYSLTTRGYSMRVSIFLLSTVIVFLSTAASALPAGHYAIKINAHDGRREPVVLKADVYHVSSLKQYVPVGSFLYRPGPNRSIFQRFTKAVTNATSRHGEKTPVVLISSIGTEFKISDPTLTRWEVLFENFMPALMAFLERNMQELNFKSLGVDEPEVNFLATGGQVTQEEFRNLTYRFVLQR